jgi:SNF2-related domain
MMTELIDRIPGFSDIDMYNWCKKLQEACESTVVRKKKTKTGVVETIERMFEINEPVENRVRNSVKFYLEKMQKEKIEFRDYQLDIIGRGTECLRRHRFLYLAMEVRTGKTLTSLGICDKVEAKSVLFVTKKKAISSIEQDYLMLGPSFKIDVINYESLHTIDNKWDVIILDEAHSLGAFPKPSGRAELAATIIAKQKPMVILLSGTPTPESYCQMYHQVYAIANNPFAEFKNFYRFAEVYADIKTKKVNSLFIKDYSHGKEKILEMMKPYTINYTQKDAGFVVETTEEILEVEMKPSTYKMIDRLKRDLVIEGKEEVILADTSVKLMTKMHQMYSGTIKFESGNSMIIDTSKAEFIKENFEGCKIGIFYKFKEEFEALKQVFGDELTTDLDEFNTTWKNIALQIVSGREGISLKMAEYLVYYNIDFSATSYWQSRDRMTTKDRLKNQVYWIFAKDGIEHKIYQAVKDKRDYTIKHFQKDLFSL